MALTMSNVHDNRTKISKEFDMFSDKLKENMGIGVCDNVVHATISRCGFKKYERVLNFITGQIGALTINPVYSLYKVNIFTKVASHHLDLIGDTQGNYYSTIQADDKHIMFNCLNLESLMIFILENTKDLTKYVFIPIVYGSVTYESGHFAILTFDIINKEVYFIDPNGKAGFFDNIFYTFSKKTDPEMTNYVNLEDMYIDTEELIENIFELYIANFNKMFGEKYVFIKRINWNPLKQTINKNYDDTTIKSGHCVCVSTLIIDYLAKTYESPKETTNKLSKLSNKEVLELINAYSMGMYNLLSNM